VEGSKKGVEIRCDKVSQRFVLERTFVSPNDDYGTSLVLVIEADKIPSEEFGKRYKVVVEPIRNLGPRYQDVVLTHNRVEMVVKKVEKPNDRIVPPRSRRKTATTRNSTVKTCFVLEIGGIECHLDAHFVKFAFYGFNQLQVEWS
jgi:hypothetical protein